MIHYYFLLILLLYVFINNTLYDIFNKIFNLNKNNRFVKMAFLKVKELIILSTLIVYLIIYLVCVHVKKQKILLIWTKIMKKFLIDIMKEENKNIFCRNFFIFYSFFLMIYFIIALEKKKRKKKYHIQEIWLVMIQLKLIII